MSLAALARRPPAATTVRVPVFNTQADRRKALDRLPETPGSKDIAAFLGISRSCVAARIKNHILPRPDAPSDNRRFLWRRKTLIRALWHLSICRANPASVQPARHIEAIILAPQERQARLARLPAIATTRDLADCLGSARSKIYALYFQGIIPPPLANGPNGVCFWAGDSVKPQLERLLIPREVK